MSFPRVFPRFSTNRTWVRLPKSAVGLELENGAVVKVGSSLFMILSPECAVEEHKPETSPKASTDQLEGGTPGEDARGIIDEPLFPKFRTTTLLPSAAAAAVREDTGGRGEASSSRRTERPVLRSPPPPGRPVLRSPPPPRPRPTRRGADAALGENRFRASPTTRLSPSASSSLLEVPAVLEGEEDPRGLPDCRSEGRVDDLPDPYEGITSEQFLREQKHLQEQEFVRYEAIECEASSNHASDRVQEEFSVDESSVCEEGPGELVAVAPASGVGGAAGSVGGLRDPLVPPKASSKKNGRSGASSSEVVEKERSCHVEHEPMDRRTGADFFSDNVATRQKNDPKSSPEGTNLSRFVPTHMPEHLLREPDDYALQLRRSRLGQTREMASFSTDAERLANSRAAQQVANLSARGTEGTNDQTNDQNHESPTGHVVPAPSERTTTALPSAGTPHQAVLANSTDATPVKATTEKTGTPAKPAAGDNDCKICYDAALDCCLYPCGHVVACLSCAQRITECPVCRFTISEVIKMYRV